MTEASLGTDRNFGLTLAALGAVLFSTKAVLVKLAYAYPLTPEALLSLRMLFAMPVYLAVAAYLSRSGARLSARDILGIAAFGLVGYYAASLLDFAALVRISVDLERLVLYTYPLIVVLLSALAFGRPITRNDMLAFGVAYLGLTLVVLDDRTRAGATPDWIDGVLLVLLSATAYAVYLIGSQKIIGRLGAKRYTALAMLAATGGTLLHFSLSGPASQLLEQPAAVYGYGFALAIFSTVLPSFLTSEGIARIGAANTAIIGALGPIATMLMAWLLLDEAITAVQLAGTALVLLGVREASRSPSR
ncbi:DMT family transporter [Methylosinus sp. Sm6]|uniref:DMT family transporter n=1 Tax=Methylosinus sp. Sm6 TaxID=2866948 RepID=UPI001C99FC70|nr:DMT family transporter [Methylosinus sp. Sm6]MBY6243046.1 DMT family transporter [Methylosinus sp. Sm6]